MDAFRKTDFYKFYSIMEFLMLSEKVRTLNTEREKITKVRSI